MSYEVPIRFLSGSYKVPIGSYKVVYKVPMIPDINPIRVFFFFREFSW